MAMAPPSRICQFHGNDLISKHTTAFQWVYENFLQEISLKSSENVSPDAGLC